MTDFRGPRHKVVLTRTSRLKTTSVGFFFLLSLALILNSPAKYWYHV